MKDHGFGLETVQTGRSLDEIVRHYKAEWEIKRYENDLAYNEGKFYSKSTIDGNILLNGGINLLLTLLAGGAGTAFSNANAYLGVGDSSTAEAATQTGLQAATNKTYAAMNASYPTYGTNQQIIFQSSFGSASANYAWNEFIAINGNGTGTALNRKVSAQGTKTTGQTWTLQLTITIS